MSKAAAEAAKFAKILASHGIRHTGASDDVFVATARGETFNGGSGSDTVSYHKSTSGVEVSLFQFAGKQFSGFAQDDVFSGIENVIGSNYADRLEGNSGANILVGLGGNDTIIGSNGDKLFGDSGEDFLQGYVYNGGTILMDGGSGADRIFLSINDGDATIKTGTGLDAVTLAIGGSQDFSVTITDFKPYFEAQGSYVSASEAARGDQLKLLFANTAEAEIDKRDFHTEVRGNDFAMVFDGEGTNGEIIFQDIGDYMDIANFQFRVDFGTLPTYEAV